MFKQICFFCKQAAMTMDEFLDHASPMGPDGEATPVELRHGEQ